MKRIVLISALFLIFQTAFAQKEDTKLASSPENSIQTTTTSLNTTIDEFEIVDIARNSGGKHGEGRLPTTYSESLSKPTILKPATFIDRNSDGKHGEGLFSGAYNKKLSKSRTNVIVDDIARNCGGRNSN